MAIKILGPAGGREAFDAAIAAGADEIYMGLTGYGARRYANNFSTDEFCTAIADAHRLGVSVSLTLNTLMSETEIETVMPELDRLVESNLDSVLVQDWGVLRFLQRRYPNLSIHASTQMALGSSADVRFAADMGLTRVVLPRELSLDEIASIREKCPHIELEVFCSGALCLGCSGKCYLSSYVGGRSGNRGSCAQPCRQHYHILSPHEENLSKDGYFLSLRDQLFTPNDIAALTQIGIDVIKIEGRMKSPAYVFESVRRYRLLADAAADGKPASDEDSLSPVQRLFNRGYSNGFLKEHDPDILNRDYASHYGMAVGEVIGGELCLTAPLVLGDGVVYLDRELKKLGGTNVSRIIRKPRLYGSTPQRVARAEAGDIVALDSPLPRETRFLYKNLDFLQQKETARSLKQARRQRGITLTLYAKIGKPLRLILSVSGPRENLISVERQSEQILEKSRKQRLDRKSVLDSVDRFGNTPFFIRDTDILFDPDVFLPKSLLNSLRQEAVRDLENRLREEEQRPRGAIRLAARVEKPDIEKNTDLPATQYAVSVRSLAQGLAAFAAGFTQLYRYPAPIRFEEGADSRELEAELLENDSFPPLPFSFQPIAGNLTEAVFYEKKGIPFTSDTSFNVVNFESGLFLLEKFSFLRTIYLSNEISRTTALRLGAELAPLLAWRGGRVGLSVYGHPIGMYTRKTLFEQRKTVLENDEKRRFFVLRNKELFAEMNPISGVTGSSVFYEPPRNVVAETLSIGAGWELRCDFTLESPDSISRTAPSLLKKNGAHEGSGYGFDHPIF